MGARQTPTVRHQENDHATNVGILDRSSLLIPFDLLSRVGSIKEYIDSKNHLYELMTVTSLTTPVCGKPLLTS